MANIKEINRKIVSLQNMQKVMRAMQMISSIKLRKLIHVQEPLNLFISSLRTITNHITGALQTSDHPVIAGYKNIKKAHVILFTGDRGLCGSHNSSVQKAGTIIIEKNKHERIETDVTCFGIKGAQFCMHKGYTIFHEATINEQSLPLSSIRELAHNLMDRFVKGEVHQVVAVNNQFVSMIHQATVTTQVLPFELPAKSGTIQKSIPTDMEPSLPDTFLYAAVELYLFYTLQSSLINSRISEQAARMTAMENSSNNSEDMINRYNRIRNRARQTSITNELIEIISGKEALKR